MLLPIGSLVGPSLSGALVVSFDYSMMNNVMGKCFLSHPLLRLFSKLSRIHKLSSDLQLRYASHAVLLLSYLLGPGSRSRRIVKTPVNASLQLQDMGAKRKSRKLGHRRVPSRHR